MVKFKIIYLNDCMEYKVCCFVNGKLNESRSYYTNDKEDAILTMGLMKLEVVRKDAKRIRKFGILVK